DYEDWGRRDVGRCGDGETRQNGRRTAREPQHPEGDQACGRASGQHAGYESRLLCAPDGPGELSGRHHARRVSLAQGTTHRPPTTRIPTRRTRIAEAAPRTNE